MIVLVGQTYPARNFLKSIGAKFVTGLPINNGWSKGWAMTAQQVLDNLHGENRDNKPAQSFIFEVNGSEFKQIKSRRLKELAAKGQWTHNNQE